VEEVVEEVEVEETRGTPSLSSLNPVSFFTDASHSLLMLSIRLQLFSPPASLSLTLSLSPSLSLPLSLSLSLPLPLWRRSWLLALLRGGRSPSSSACRLHTD